MPKGPKSEETRRKISEALKGRKLSPETCAKMSASRMGRKLSEEWRENIGNARRGKHYDKLSGQNNPRWAGGRFIGAGGYVFILHPGHPHANQHGYVREHILVMTAKLGRPLASNEVVHHINGVRNDNREENLIVMTRAAHASEHHKGLMKPNSLKNLQLGRRGRIPLN